MRNDEMSPEEKWAALSKIHDTHYHAALACAYILLKQNPRLAEGGRNSVFWQQLNEIWRKAMLHIHDEKFGPRNWQFLENIGADLATVLPKFD